MYLGMTDGSIRDDQVKVSSEQPLYPASGIRPYHKGWCASVQDASPTVTVSPVSITSIVRLVYNI